MRYWGKCLGALLGLVLSTTVCFASDFGRNLKVQEEDGTPTSVPVYTVRVPNGTLTQNAVGDVSLDYINSTTADSTYLKLDQTTPQVITAADATITASDEVYYGDVTDSTKIKKDTVQGILDLVPAPDLTPYALLAGATFVGAIKVGDNIKHLFGTGLDASIYYDGTNLVINPKEAGLGILSVLNHLTVSGDLTVNGGDLTIFGNVGTNPDSASSFGGRGANALTGFIVNPVEDGEVITYQVRETDVLKLYWNGSALEALFYKTLKTAGGRIGKITTVTDTYSILATDETVVCNKATAFTVTLPTAVVGQKFTIKNIGAGTVTVDGAGSDTLDGAASYPLSQYASATVQCIAANTWSLI